MMNIDKLFERRNLGIVRIGFYRPMESAKWGPPYGPEPISSVLSRFGLSYKDDALFHEIDRLAAFDILNALLLKDMAYRSVLMQPNEAKLIADDFLSLFPEAGSRYFTNGLWDQYGSSSAFNYVPLTEATFDGGVIVLSDEINGCLWFEDED